MISVKRWLKDNKFDILLSVVLLLIVLPILFACKYAGPSRDDFVNSVGWMSYNNGGHFKYLFAAAWYDYRTFQGTYFGSFINYFPVYYVWGYVGLRVWFVLNAILFFGSFLVFLSELFNWMGVKHGRRTATLLIAIVALFYGICLIDCCDDIFYWYTGACMYTVPLSLSFLSISCYFKYEMKEKSKYIFWGSAMAFMGSGAILVVPAFLCGFLFLAIIYNKVSLKTMKKSAWIGLAALVGALINTVAPGNFVRATDDMNGFITLINLIRRVSGIYSQDLGNGSLLLLILVSFVVGLKYLENSTFKFSHPGLIAIICILGPAVVDIPITLSGSNVYTKGSLVNRYIFVEHMCIAICFTFASLYFAGWINQNHKWEYKRTPIIIAFLVCAIHLSPLIDAENFIELTPFHMVQHMIINDNDFKKFSLRQEDILKQIEESNEEDVVVYSYRKQGGEWCNLSLIGLTDDENDLWYSVNRYLAKYYGKNTVTLKYLD